MDRRDPLRMYDERRDWLSWGRYATITTLLAGSAALLSYGITLIIWP